MYMADGSSNQTRRRCVIVRARTRRPAVSRPTLAAPLFLAFALAACGGETAPGLGADTIPTTTIATTTSTVPAETTTTIDFNRPVTQELTLLPDDGMVAEFADIINDMRGQSNQVSEQMKRLAEFETLPSPAGAQILDFSTVVVPVLDEGYSISSVVEFRLPQDAAVMTTFIEEELRALGWNKSSESTQFVNGINQNTLVFRIPGTPGDETELTASIGSAPGATLVTYDYRTRLETTDLTFSRLHAWQNTIRTPSGAEVVEASVKTADDTGTLSVVQLLNAETAAEARELVAALVREDEFQIITSQDSGTTAAPLLLQDEEGNQMMLEFALSEEPAIVEMTVINTFALEPVG